jgi:hypothetical protein
MGIGVFVCALKKPLTLTLPKRRTAQRERAGVRGF